MCWQCRVWQAMYVMCLCQCISTCVLRVVYVFVNFFFVAVRLYVSTYVCVFASMCFSVCACLFMSLFIVQNNDVFYMRRWAVKKSYSEISVRFCELVLSKLFMTQLLRTNRLKDSNLSEYDFEGIRQKMLHSAVETLKTRHYAFNVMWKIQSDPLCHLPRML